jgi:hypothetical protein
VEELSGIFRPVARGLTPDTGNYTRCINDTYVDTVLHLFFHEDTGYVKLVEAY